jgi:hypothetical protein
LVTGSIAGNSSVSAKRPSATMSRAARIVRSLAAAWSAGTRAWLARLISSAWRGVCGLPDSSVQFSSMRCFAASSTRTPSSHPIRLLRTRNVVLT